MKDDLNKIRHNADQILEEVKEENTDKIKKMVAETKNTANHLKQVSGHLYLERNQLVVQRLRMYQKLGITVGYKIDQESPESDWLVWYVLEQDHKRFGHIGQMGWHIHKDEFDPEQTDWINAINQRYDGHTTEEKLKRMRQLDRKIVKEEIEYTRPLPTSEEVEKVEQFLESSNQPKSIGEITKHTGLPRDKAKECVETLKSGNKVKIGETVGRTHLWVKNSE